MKVVHQTDRAFGFTFAGLFFLLAVGRGLFGARIVWALSLAIIFALLALFVPDVLMPLNRLWRWIGSKIAVINNVIVLGIVFYLLVTPIALIMRLFGRDSMHRSIDEKVATYRTPVRRRTNGENFSDQF
jgi:hypothetical protein